MKYRTKLAIVEATQWWENGDHPEDDVFRPFEDTGGVPSEPREGAVVRYFRRPDVPADKVCQRCGNHMQIHGWIDTAQGGHVVCPGDFIISIQNERYPCKPDVFNTRYEPIPESEEIGALL